MREIALYELVEISRQADENDETVNR